MPVVNKPRLPFQKVVIMAGGTGGHVFPALAIAEALRERGVSVTWLGTAEKIEAKVVPKAGFELDTLTIQSLRGRGVLAWGLLPLRLWKAVRQAKAVLQKRQPDLVIGLGGFAAGPGGIAAWRLGIPLVIHEQNAIPGLTNRILARFARQIFTGFSTAFAHHPKAQYVGNPLRQTIIDAAQTPPTPIRPASQPLHILIVGGSLGARAINQRVPKALAPLAGQVRIWHQTGEKTLAETQALYQELGVSAQVVPFIEDMVEAYRFADVVICRAGALTVAELAAMGKAAILVPLPSAADDHQRHNAEFLATRHAAICQIEAEFTVERLQTLLKSWIADRQPLQTMSQNARALAKLEATEQVIVGLEAP